jgi:hypothetical protein
MTDLLAARPDLRMGGFGESARAFKLAKNTG